MTMVETIAQRIASNNIAVAMMETPISGQQLVDLLEANNRLLRRLAAQSDGWQSAGEGVGTVAAPSAEFSTSPLEAGTAAPPADPASGPDAVARAIVKLMKAAEDCGATDAALEYSGGASGDPREAVDERLETAKASLDQAISSALAAAEKRGEERGAPVKAALIGLLDRYVDMINSGDCGSWNPEEEACVIAARAALADERGG